MPQALLIVLLMSISVLAQSSGRVVGISDGDTITILSDRKQTKVRLAGIDAPEKGQDYSEVAKRHISGLIYNKTVTLKGDKIDRYGRLVAKVMFDGKDINLLMVQNGLAWHFSKYAREQSREDRLAYSTAEAEARNAKLNLWRYPNPVAPWDFRSGESTTRQSSTTTIRPLVSRPLNQVANGQIIGNKKSMIYHSPGCRDYDKVSEKNRVHFRTAQDAERAGYRAARNC